MKQEGNQVATFFEAFFCVGVVPVQNLIQAHFKETKSEISKKIINNFNQEIYNFIQVCPKEMINKLENPITDKIKVKEVS